MDKFKKNKPLIIGVISILLLCMAFSILLFNMNNKIDINHASQEELISLPNLGPVLADRIIAGRPYNNINELDRVKGIGIETIRSISDEVKVGGY